MSVTDGLYQEIILDHYKHPQGKGLREPYDTEVHHTNPMCGDEVTLRVLVAGGDQGVVKDVSYDGDGCAISQASASVLYETVVGMPVGEALRRHAAFTELLGSRGTVEPDEDLLGDGVAFAGVAKLPARVKCALLAWMAFADAVIRTTPTGEGCDDD